MKRFLTLSHIYLITTFALTAVILLVKDIRIVLVSLTLSIFCVTQIYRLVRKDDPPKAKAMILVASLLFALGIVVYAYVKYSRAV